MGVSYNNFTLRPTPFVQIEKSYSNKNNTIQDTSYEITLIGNIVVGPGLDYETQGMDSIQSIQTQIMNAFAVSNQILTIESPDPDQIDSGMQFYCEVLDVSFADGIWFDICPYTIRLRSDKLEGTDNANFDNISEFGESWRISNAENGSYQVTHDIFAVGQNTVGPTGASGGFDAARTFVRNRIGVFSDDQDVDSDLTFTDTTYDPTDSSNGSPNVLDETSYWNRSIVEQIDPDDLRYSIAETYVYFDPSSPTTSSIETWSAVVTENNDSIPNRKTVSIRGNIQGLSKEDSDISFKLTNAKADFALIQSNLLTRVTPYFSDYPNVTSVPIRLNYTENTALGTIDYEAEFVGTKEPLLSNTIEESLTINDVGSTDVFAEIPVPGRLQGPVVQWMETRSLPRRVVNYTAKMNPNFLTSGSGSGSASSSSILAAYNAKPNTDSIFTALLPSGTGIKYYLDENSENWNPTTFEYSRTMSWTIDLVSDGNIYNGYQDPTNFGDR